MSLKLSTDEAAKFILGSFRSEETSRQLIEVRAHLGKVAASDDRVLRAVAACRMGLRPEIAGRFLGWKEFESFCSDLLRYSGFEVQEDVRTRKPSRQIDLVALCPSVILSVDCKHWQRQSSLSALSKFANAQLKRNSILRTKLPDRRPIVSAIVTLREQQERFVNGVAVVPLFTLRDFLDNVASHMVSLVQT